MKNTFSVLGNVIVYPVDLIAGFEIPIIVFFIADVGYQLNKKQQPYGKTEYIKNCMEFIFLKVIPGRPEINQTHIPLLLVLLFR